MNEAQFEAFLETAIQELQEKNGLLRSQHGIGDYARWDHDGDREQITFSNPDDPEVLVAETTSIGSFSTRSNTWLWAWANESLTDAAREKAAPLKELFESTGMRFFAEAGVNCDEYLAWELAAVSVQHLGGLGCYRGPADHLWIFWSIDSLATARRDA